MSGFVPSASNPDGSQPSGPTPPAGFPTGPTPPSGGDDWSDGLVAGNGGGDDDKGRSLSPVLIVLIAVLGIALIGFGAYTFLGRSSTPEPAPVTPTVAPTAPTASPSPTAPALKPIPNVVGFTVEEATRSLETEGFIVGTVSAQPSELADGTILAQDPASGVQSAPGATVNLIAAGPAEPVVPDVEGMKKTAAVNALIAAGLKPGKILEEESKRKPGTVLSQSPQPGKTVKEGTKINLTIASGKTKVPNVIGLTKARATAVLEDAGFTVKAKVAPKTKKGKAGTVVDQNPKKNAAADVGSIVIISIAAKR